MAQQNQQGGEVRTETGEMLKGPKFANLQQEQGGGSKQLGGKSVKEGSAQQQHQGGDRTPDKVQGQIKHARGQTKKGEGGAGEPETSKLEPEKQGGIGGP